MSRSEPSPDGDALSAGFRHDTTKTPVHRTGVFAFKSQELGRLPWLALLFLRPLRLRALLPISAPRGSTSAGAILARVRREASIAELAVEGCQDGAGHGLRLVASNGGRSGEHLLAGARHHHGQDRHRHVAATHRQDD